MPRNAVLHDPTHTEGEVFVARMLWGELIYRTANMTTPARQGPRRPHWPRKALPLASGRLHKSFTPAINGVERMRAAATTLCWWGMG